MIPYGAPIPWDDEAIFKDSNGETRSNRLSMGALMLGAPGHYSCTQLAVRLLPYGRPQCLVLDQILSI